LRKKLRKKNLLRRRRKKNLQKRRKSWKYLKLQLMAQNIIQQMKMMVLFMQ
jgi:hypothetical protein